MSVSYSQYPSVYKADLFNHLSRQSGIILLVALELYEQKLSRDLANGVSLYLLWQMSFISEEVTCKCVLIHCLDSHVTLVQVETRA